MPCQGIPLSNDPLPKSQSLCSVAAKWYFDKQQRVPQSRKLGGVFMRSWYCLSKIITAREPVFVRSCCRRPRVARLSNSQKRPNAGKKSEETSRADQPFPFKSRVQGSTPALERRLQGAQSLSCEETFSGVHTGRFCRRRQQVTGADRPVVVAVVLQIHQDDWQYRRSGRAAAPSSWAAGL